MNTLRKNVVYSSVLTVSGYLFSFLTFPYVTRVLGVSNIGICNFVDSIVQYFIFFSMMGITTLGIREVARTKSNEVQLTKTYSSLLTLNLIATIIAVTTLLIATYCVPQLRAHKYMFFVGAAKVFASTLQIEWLFKGLEDFKYITTRTIIIRCIYVLSVFLNPNPVMRSCLDLYLYNKWIKTLTINQGCCNDTSRSLIISNHPNLERIIIKGGDYNYAPFFNTDAVFISSNSFINDNMMIFLNSKHSLQVHIHSMKQQVLLYQVYSN